MQFQYNRKLAVVILIVCILASIVGLGGLGLARERNEGLRIYEEGAYSTAVRMSVDAYLDNSADYARIMAEEYRLHVGESEEAMDKVLKLIDEMIDEPDLGLRNAAYKSLSSAIETLYSDFHATVTSEEKLEDFDRAYANYQSEKTKIGYDDYNVYSREFNQLRKSFPAGLIAAIFGLDGLETFG